MEAQTVIHHEGKSQYRVRKIVGRTGREAFIVLDTHLIPENPVLDKELSRVLGLGRPRGLAPKVAPEKPEVSQLSFMNTPGRRMHQFENTTILRVDELAGYTPLDESIGEKPKKDSGLSAEEVIDRALSSHTKEWPMYVSEIRGGRLEKIEPAILKYVGCIRAGKKTTYEYTLSDVKYLSSLPPEAFALYKTNELYYKFLEWKKIGDEYIRCHVACFPLSQKRKLQELHLLNK